MHPEDELCEVEVLSIPNEPGISYIRYMPDFSCLCSIGEAPFYGVMFIEFRPGDRLLEFESFEAWIGSWSTQSMTIEDVARLVFDKLTEVLGKIPLKACVHASTTKHGSVDATIIRGEWPSCCSY